MGGCRLRAGQNSFGRCGMGRRNFTGGVTGLLFDSDLLMENC